MLKISFLLTLISLHAMSQDIKNKDFQKIVKKYTSKFQVPLMSVGELKKIIGKSKESVLILDARELKEYEVSKIKGAQFVGYDDFKVNDIDRKLRNFGENKKIVVYCSVGYRSGDIAEKLKTKGYRVHNLYGGIFEWVNQGNEVYDLKNQVTNKVHTYNKDWSKWLFVGEKVY